MRNKEQGISKKDKLLIVINEMSFGKQITLKYEDIFVKAFKKYPHDFHLRGYPEYPDTGDSTQRPLYNLRTEGLIQVRSKFVTITEKGIAFAEKLMNEQSSYMLKSSQKLSRDIFNEIERIKNTDAFQLFITDKKDHLVDTDFFAYLGTTVKTDRTDFKARLKTIQDVIETIKANDSYKIIVDLNNYLFAKFENMIKTKLSIGYPRRKHERNIRNHGRNKCNR